MCAFRGKSAGMIVTEVAGHSVQGASVADDSAPVIYAEENTHFEISDGLAPAAEVGSPYPLLDARAHDPLFGEIECEYSLKLRGEDTELYGDVSEDELYRAVNIAQPSLIRTEADELTYPLHVMIRYEIERALFAGEATARDIPGMWSDLTAKYLGIEVPDDTHGCLQDTHWSGGDFGYFPTYALGSAYGSQLLRAMVAEGVDFGEACASGDLAPVRAWLGDKIWRWGRSKDAPELIEGACGEPFDATYYCSYLAKKFGALYAL